MQAKYKVGNEQNMINLKHFIKHLIHALFFLEGREEGNGLYLCLVCFVLSQPLF